MTPQEQAELVEALRQAVPPFPADPPDNWTKTLTESSTKTALWCALIGGLVAAVIAGGISLYTTAQTNATNEKVANIARQAQLDVAAMAQNEKKATTAAEAHRALLRDVNALWSGFAGLHNLMQIVRKELSDPAQQTQINDLRLNVGRQLNTFFAHKDEPLLASETRAQVSLFQQKIAPTLAITDAVALLTSMDANRTSLQREYEGLRRVLEPLAIP